MRHALRISLFALAALLFTPTVTEAQIQEAPNGEEQVFIQKAYERAATCYSIHMQEPPRLTFSKINFYTTTDTRIQTDEGNVQAYGDPMGAFLVTKRSATNTRVMAHALLHLMLGNQDDHPDLFNKCRLGSAHVR